MDYNLHSLIIEDANFQQATGVIVTDGKAVMGPERIQFEDGAKVVIRVKTPCGGAVEEMKSLLNQLFRQNGRLIIEALTEDHILATSRHASISNLQLDGDEVAFEVSY